MSEPERVPVIVARPILDHRGFVVVFDLWVDGTWVGSRRTPEQCAEFLSRYCGVPIEPYSPTPW